MRSCEQCATTYEDRTTCPTVFLDALGNLCDLFFFRVVDRCIAANIIVFHGVLSPRVADRTALL
nr:MAG TPA: hypothetical protein [Caudoviricetes sp.]